MPHLTVKFKTIFDRSEGEYFKTDIFGNKEEHGDGGISKADAKSWHLITSQADGESTACGQVYADYGREIKEVEKGGITCEDCLSLIREMKAVKL